MSDRNHGRDAISPWNIPAAGWKQIIVRTWNQSWVDNAGLVAAGVAFYGFLALVPLLAILVLAYGLIAEPQTVVSNMEALTRILPPNIAAFVGEQLMGAVHSAEGTKGFGILAAAGLALYGGSNGAGAIIMALNVAYREKEKRSLLQFYGLAIGMTLCALLVALAALAATAAVAALERLMPQASGPVLLAGKLASYVFLALAAAAVAATLYRYGPSREDARWEWITPGSLFTAVTWLLLTLGFGFYVTKVTDYNATYGSLGAIIALLTWMYLSAYVFVFGAELNSEIEHQTVRDSTTGPEEPMGERGAWAADNVADGEAPKQSVSMSEASPGVPGREDEIVEKG